MKIVAASDLHLHPDARAALLRQAEAADLVLIAGDFANQHKGLADYMAPLEAIAGKALCVAGNNETVAALREATTIPVLHGNAIETLGLTVAGLGMAVPPLPPLPWNSADLTEEEAAELLAQIETADILLCHSPPHASVGWHGALGDLGSTAIRAAIERLQPRLFLCGHVHDSWGARDRIGITPVANLGPVPVHFEIDADP